MIATLLKIVTKDTIFEKKNTKFYCTRFIFKKNIEKKLLNPKKEKEALKGKKKLL